MSGSFLVKNGIRKIILDNFNCMVKVVICLICRDFRIFGFDGICALEQESCLACLDHAEVVVAVTAGDGVISDRLPALTVVYLDFSQRILKSVISPLSATTRELQKIVG